MSSALGRAIASNSSVTLYYIRYYLFIRPLVLFSLIMYKEAPCFLGNDIGRRRTHNRFTINYK